MRLKISLACLVIMLGALSISGLGYNLNIEVGSSNTVTASSIDSKLSDSSSLSFEASGTVGAFSQTGSLSGTGQNYVGQRLASTSNAKSYDDASIIDTTGIISLATTSAAFREGAAMSHDLDVNGDTAVILSGISGSSSVGQRAKVENGIISSALDLAVGSSVLASQSTIAEGDLAAVDSCALSENNYMAAAGGYYDARGDLKARIVSASSGGAVVDGSASVAGIQCLKEGESQGMFDPDLDGSVMSVNGFFGGDRNIGNFGFRIVNINSKADLIRGDDTQAKENVLSGVSVNRAGAPRPVGPSDNENTVAGGNPDNFVFFNELYNINSPGSWPDYYYPTWEIVKPVKSYLKDDSNLQSTGMKTASVLSAVNRAAGTWDYWTSDRLFLPAASTKKSEYAIDTLDGKNVIGFLGYDDPGVAYACTYAQVSGRRVILTESDISFSQNIVGVFPNTWGWTTDWKTGTNPSKKKLDFQTILMHELGHTCGLGDLYLLPSDDPRHYNQRPLDIMNGGDILSNHFAQHNLGMGDITGLRRIYMDKPLWK